MSTSIANEIAKLIDTTLQQITIDNGYLTDLGKSVHRGFYAQVLDGKETEFPAIAVHPAVETVVSTQGSDRVTAKVQSDFVFVVMSKVARNRDAYDEARNCLSDVRRAFYSRRDEFRDLTKRDELELGESEPDLTRDTAFMIYAQRITICFNETYSK